MVKNEEADTVMEGMEKVKFIVEKPPATCDRLRIRWRKTKTPEKKKRVDCRRPFRAIEAVTPSCPFVLAIEKLPPPTNPTDLCSCCFPRLRRLLEEVPFRLPADCWVSIGEPSEDEVVHMAMLPVLRYFGNPDSWALTDHRWKGTAA